MTVELKIEGFAELMQELKGLEPKLRNKVYGVSLRAGSKIVQQAAKEQAPTKDGLLKKGILVRRDTKAKKFGLIRDTIGFSKDAWYGRLVEYGHKIVRGGRLGKGGKVVGHVAAKPFLRPAFDNNVEKTVSAIKSKFHSELDKLHLPKLKSGRS